MEFPFSKAPEPPYHAVIFTSTRIAAPEDGYFDMLSRMLELAPQQDGYLGVESVNIPLEKGQSSPALKEDETEIQGITVSYWRDEEAVRGWKRQIEHLHAQKLGKKKWYRKFEIRVARVERAYGFDGGG